MKKRDKEVADFFVKITVKQIQDQVLELGAEEGLRFLKGVEDGIERIRNERGQGYGGKKD